MKVRIRPIGLAMAMLVVATGQAKAGNLIINGDFSQPDAATLPNDGSVYKFVYAGDPSLTGWTVTNGSVETDVTIPTFGPPRPAATSRILTSMATVPARSPSRLPPSLGSPIAWLSTTPTILTGPAPPRP